MELPKTKQKKLINLKEFAKIAKKAKESFDEEAKYLREISAGNENNSSAWFNNYPYR
jgi:hypothetical protein